MRSTHHMYTQTNKHTHTCAHEYRQTAGDVLKACNMQWRQKVAPKSDVSEEVQQNVVCCFVEGARYQVKIISPAIVIVK